MTTYFDWTQFIFHPSKIQIFYKFLTDDFTFQWQWGLFLAYFMPFTMNTQWLQSRIFELNNIKNACCTVDSDTSLTKNFKKKNKSVWITWHRLPWRHEGRRFVKVYFLFSYYATAGPGYFFVPLLAGDFYYRRKNIGEWISLPSYFSGKNTGGAADA